MSAPDYLEPLVGFRTWRVKEGKLSSPYFLNNYWRPGINQAKCRKLSLPHHTFRLPSSLRNLPQEGLFLAEAPNPSCKCGLYAYHQPQYHWRSLSLAETMNWQLKRPEIAGAVLGWGKVEYYPTGFRAQYAKPILLCYEKPEQLPESIEKLAANYQLPVVPYQSLYKEARQLASQGLSYKGVERG